MQPDRPNCFFCNQKIEKKTTKEHIIPDFLLNEMGIKENKIGGHNPKIYSRIKVQAHKECNDTFGSRYESHIKELLKNKFALSSKINSSEIQRGHITSPREDPSSIIKTWLTKIYYGFYYYDSVHGPNEEYKHTCKQIITAHNFKMMQAAYKINKGFQLPSSLFSFYVKNSDFDFKTFIHPQVIMLKIQRLLLIQCIGDMNFTRAAIGSNNLNGLQKHIELEEEKGMYLSYLQPVIEICSIAASLNNAAPVFLAKNKIISLAGADRHGNTNLFDNKNYLSAKKQMNIIIQEHLDKA